MRCPRRDESFGADVRFPGPDEYRPHRGESWPVCSYCGSLDPAHFMQRAAEGARLCPTDKSYKVYIDIPNPRVGKERIVGTANHTVEGWLSPWSERAIRVARETGYRLDESVVSVQIGIEGATETLKFYFPHLSAEQQQRFVELLNARTLNLATPGHFYVLPFFCMRHPKGETA